MMLLIDVGNSRIKWATLPENGALSTQQSTSYDLQRLEQLFAKAWLMLEIPWRGVYIANVANPDLSEALAQWVRNSWGIEAIFIETTPQACGIINGYEKPQQLGVDRWLSLIGAKQLVEKGVICVVDCGTAITLDVLSARGKHLGGLIMPGIQAMRQSLFQNTHALETLVKETNPNEVKLLAKNSHVGINSGTICAAVGMLEYVMHRLEEHSDNINLILTGGAAPTLLPFIQKNYQYVPDLVLQGMVVLVNQYT